MSSTANGAPKHLSRASRAWYRSVLADYELEPHHVKLLLLAAESFDRATEAREAITKHGAVLADRFGQLRPNPSIAIERDSRIAFARLVRDLQLDDESSPRGR